MSKFAFSSPIAVVFMVAGLSLACGGETIESPADTGGSGGVGASGGSGGTAGETGGAGGTGAGGTSTGGTGVGGTGVGGTGVGGTAGVGGTGGNTGGGSCCAGPPEPDPSAPTGAGPGMTFAISQMYLGDLEPDGTPSQTAWQKYGWDIDGQVTTKDSTYHCQPQEGGVPNQIKTDGDEGIDNSFGANLMPIFAGLASDFSYTFNEAMHEGALTYLWRIEGLGAALSYQHLRASVFIGGTYGGMPSWNGSDSWPVRCEWMQECTASGTPQLGQGNDSTLVFADSYMTDGYWVSNGAADVPFMMPFIDGLWNMPMRHVRAGFSILPGSGMGVISGVMQTEQAIAELAKIAGSISTSLCSGPTFDSVAQQFRAASDIMADGTQDPSQMCTGISVGLGFDVVGANVGQVLDKEPPQPDPCADY